MPDSVCFQGKGIPDLNTRLLVKKLWDTFHIPVFTLVDADPHGNLSWTIWDDSPVVTESCCHMFSALRTFVQCAVWTRG